MPCPSLSSCYRGSLEISAEADNTTQVPCDDLDSGDDLMALSAQAANGTEGFQTMRLRGHLNGKEVFMLIDSGSSHSFVDDQVAAHIQPWKPLPQSVRVTVANGGVITCTHELSDQLWEVQDHSFRTTLKIIPLSGYDVKLGMDWLESNSPMEIHWVERWLQFHYKGQVIKLQGLTSQPTLGPPVSSLQLRAFDKSDSILYVVELQSISPAEDSIENTLPIEL